MGAQESHGRGIALGRTGEPSLLACALSNAARPLVHTAANSLASSKLTQCGSQEGNANPTFGLTGVNIEDLDDISCSSASSVSSEELSETEEELLLAPRQGPAGLRVDVAEDEEIEQGPGSEVYRRQSTWLEEKNKKKQTMKEEKEKKAMEGITGKPDLGKAQESWKRTKMIHEQVSKEGALRARLVRLGRRSPVALIRSRRIHSAFVHTCMQALRKQKADEIRKEEARIMKEEADERRRLREIDGLRLQAKIKKRLRLSKIDKGKQAESLERMSKPRNGVSAAAAVGVKVSNRAVFVGDGRHTSGSKRPACFHSLLLASLTNTRCAQDEADLEIHRAKERLKDTAAAATEENMEGGDDGFGDMDEKQYIQVMKALGLDPGITGKNKKKGGGNKVRQSKIDVDIGPLELEGLEGEEDEEEEGEEDGYREDESNRADESLVNVGSVERGEQPEPNRDWTKADFVNDTGVMKEIDDVFAELEDSKWGATDEPERERALETSLSEQQEEYKFEESADDADFEEEEVGRSEAEAKGMRSWKFSGHTNNEGIMAHASSALEAAEAALGFLGGNAGAGGEGDNTHTHDIEDVFNKAIEVHVEPYEKYEREGVGFFDKSSSSEKGRFRVRDARLFAPESMRRKEDADKGVMLLVGKKGEGDVEAVITILFDKAVFTELTAIEWWKGERHRFVGEGKFAAGGDKPKSEDMFYY